MAEADLSLSGELLLLSIDPAEGGLFPRRRSRFRKALGSRRVALHELRSAGLVKGVLRLRVVDRAAAARCFARVQRCLREDGGGSDRDRQLAVLLAWTGVLGARLSRGERRVAARRLREVAAAALAPRAGDSEIDVLDDALYEVATGDVGVDSGGSAVLDFGASDAGYDAR